MFKSLVIGFTLFASSLGIASAQTLAESLPVVIDTPQKDVWVLAKIEGTVKVALINKETEQSKVVWNTGCNIDQVIVCTRVSGDDDNACMIIQTFAPLPNRQVSIQIVRLCPFNSKGSGISISTGAWSPLAPNAQQSQPPSNVPPKGIIQL